MADNGKKAIWLIDGAYLYKAMRKFQWDNAPMYDNKGLDYKKLKDALRKEYGLASLDAWYFNSTPDPPQDLQNKFHGWLKAAEPDGPGIIVQLYKLKRKLCTCPDCDRKFKLKVQKGVDVGLATKGLLLCKRYDAMILSSGDGDFEDFVRRVREDEGLDFSIAGFHDSVSLDLQQHVNMGVYWIDEKYNGVCDMRFEPPYKSADEDVDFDDDTDDDVQADGATDDADGATPMAIEPSEKQK